MPPIFPRKRLRSDSPHQEPPPKRTGHHPHPRRSKDSVFDTLDAPPTVSRTLSQTKKFFEQGGDDSELSSSESSDDEFEDVPIADNKAKGKQKAQDSESEESEDEVWEDALGTKHHTKHDDEPAPIISGDIELMLSAPSQVAFSLKSDGKKGASKIERHIRNVTHCMHVQMLMYHNTIRNGWIQDTQVQKIMVDSMTTGCWKEVDRFWRDAGILDGHKHVVQGGWTKKTARDIESSGAWKDSGKNGVQVYESPKGKGPKSKSNSKPGSSKGKGQDTRTSDRNQRDWGTSSDRLEPNVPNLSAGDPLLRLLKYLSAFWKAKFKTTAPCLRKRGYLSPSTLGAEILAWKDDGSDADAFGERVENLEDFRNMARKCSGSRDVGQQLFTALLRGLGIEARMVASLQPVGFGWSQAEEGKAKDLKNLKTKTTAREDMATSPPGKTKEKVSTTNGTKHIPIDISDSDDLSSAISISSDADRPIRSAKSSPKVRKYGEELPHPTYWTEAISNLTHTPISVSCLPRPVIATSSMPEQLLSFYCRGAAADKAKQVFAYLIAFSSDGSAKDVTMRYLPKHQWPGKTKGFRMAIEKIPIHNKRGKVKRWEEWDWFKSVLRPYARPYEKRQPWDEVEDEGDLVPAQPTKPKDMDEEGGKETLQGYKTSAEYALERHLRREEAIKPGAKIIRHFTTGKGENEKKEPVYLRKDVVTCKSVESWHKEGRAVKEGEQPLKFVPMRAVTVIRKREIEEREREEGEKVKQGLYSKAQTDWIIPDPIVDGKIPRNAFGNIDVYVPTMVPKGAVHVRLKGTAKICRKLKIDYAEACTGFEFGKQRAVPILTGVVVAAEHKDLLIDAWKAAEAEKAIKEQDKREKLVLGMWKKLFVGLRIVERMKREYGDASEIPTTTAKGTKYAKKSEWDTFQDHDDFEGGFVRDEPQGGGGFIQEDEGDDGPDEGMAGGFFVGSQEEPANGDALTIDHGEGKHLEPRKSVAESAYQTPISLSSAHRKPSNEDNDEKDAEERSEMEDEAPILPPTRRTRGTAQSSRGRGRGRGTKRVFPTTRKTASQTSSMLPSPTPSPSSDESSPEILPTSRRANQKPSPPPKSQLESPVALELLSEAEDIGTARRGKRKVSASPTRSVPRRKSARKSEAQVKSHYFADGSDEETDLTDRSPVKKGVGGRGRGKGRGRGRGTGQGRGRRSG
jgi:xeroderma pigmentosum group C-complementing protein